MVSSSTSVQAANTRARAGSGAGTSLRSSQAVSIVAARKSSDDTSARRKPVLVVMPRIAVSPRASGQDVDRLVAGRRPGDDLAEHRVVGGADLLLGLEGVVDTDAVT